jgi:phosphoglycolate phosphatase-like HAD superfamily hydrolase
VIRARRPKILFFDIDGTLVLTDGAGRRAMTRAFEELFGGSDVLTHVPMAGRTDSVILADAMRAANVPPAQALTDRFRSRYTELLAEELARPSHLKRILPGIAELLPQLDERGDVFLGLVTGNYSDGARLKLGHFDLWRYFQCGAFGEEAHDRDELVPIAMARARARGAIVESAAQVAVIGDTPHDVRCAAVVGALSIAVATGGCDRTMLEDAGADIVFDDLSDTRAFLDVLEGQERP